MKRRHILLFILASGHLTLVFVGGAQLELRRFGALGRVLATYSDLSGASSGYGFFAPGVGTHLRAVFDVSGGSSAPVQERLESRGSREAELRIGNIVSLFWEHVFDERVRRSLAASWAGKILARHPSARKASMRLESYELPNMSDYHRGVRGEWKPFYRASFVRHAGDEKGARP